MSLKKNPHSLLTQWGNAVLRRPFSLLVFIGLLAYASWQYTATHLSINTDTAELVAPDAPFQQNRRIFEKAFAQDMHTLLLVVESSTPELTQAATQRLRRLLNADKSNFTSVSIPSDNPFFKQNGLLYLKQSELQDLSSALSQAQPFIGRIAQQPNISGFFGILGDALTTDDKSQEVPIDLSLLLNKVSGALHDSLNNQPALLSWQQLISEKVAIQQTNKGFILALPVFDYSQIRPAESAITAIQRAIVEIQDSNLPAVKVWITGEVGLEDDELAGMSSGTFTASIFSLVLVCFILLLAYRSLVFMLATFFTLALGMVFCGFFAALSVKELNLISVAFAVSNIGLGVEYSIHFCLRYQDTLRQNIERGRAIRSTIVSTSPSLLLCAATTAIGLYAFIPTDYKGVSELGLLAGTSLFICLLVTLTVLPAALSFLPTTCLRRSENESDVLSKFAEKLAHYPLHFAKPIAFITAGLAVVSLFLLFHVQTDFNPINLRDPNTESVIAFKNLLKDKDNTPMTLTVLAKNEAEAKDLQKKLATLSSVDKTISLFDFLPDAQDDKLAMLEDMELMLGLQGGFPQLTPEQNMVSSVKTMLNALDHAIAKRTNPQDLAALQQFKAQLQDLLIELDNRQEPDRSAFVARIQSTLLGTLPTVMNNLLTGFAAQNITLGDLPADIKDRWLSRDGLYRIQIFAKDDLNDLAKLEKFITQVQALAPNTTDLPIMYWESMKEVVGAFQQAITIALITIAVALFSIRRNIKDTLLVMTPLILAGLFTMASAVLTHTPINFANIIALPLLLGFGVDNGIHMVEKLHHSLSEQQNIYASSTARAMFYGALTTSSSFAGLAFSSHQGIASMGLVITMGIFWIMLCTFVVLPALSKLTLTDAPAK